MNIENNIIKTIEKYDSISFYERIGDKLVIHSNAGKIDYKMFRKLFYECRKLGYIVRLNPISDSSSQFAYFVYKDYSSANLNVFIPLSLSFISFIVTLVSIYFTSYYYIYVNNFYDTILFIFGISLILLFHELGHFVAEKLNHVKNSFPIFLPAPLYGTYGIIPRLREIFIDRIQTFDFSFIGIMFMLIPTLFFSVFGLMLSKVVSIYSLTKTNYPFPLPLIFYLIFKLILPNNYVILLHPFFIISLVGFMLTFINLSPLSQLDGGFLSISFFGTKKIYYNFFNIIALFIFIFVQLYFLAFLGLYLLLFFRFEPFNIVSNLDRKRKIIYTVLITLWILLIPISSYSNYSLFE